VGDAFGPLGLVGAALSDLGLFEPPRRSLAAVAAFAHGPPQRRGPVVGDPGVRKRPEIRG
jgi:hypothetical protein